MAWFMRAGHKGGGPMNMNLSPAWISFLARPG